MRARSVPTLRRLVSIWRPWLTQARRLGWPAGIGVLLLAAAGAIAWIAAPLSRRDLADEETRLASWRAQRLHDAQPGAGPGRTSAQGFRDVFPDAAQRHGRAQALLDIAQRHDLRLERVEMRMVAEPRLRMSRYTVLMPLAGSYAGVRGFVEQALAGDAAVSLDSLRIEQRNVPDGLLRVELQFSLWMRADDGPARS